MAEGFGSLDTSCCHCCHVTLNVVDLSIRILPLLLFDPRDLPCQLDSVSDDRDCECRSRQVNSGICHAMSLRREAVRGQEVAPGSPAGVPLLAGLSGSIFGKTAAHAAST